MKKNLGFNKMKFYSLVLRKSIEIPKSKIREVTKSGRRFAVGKYTAKGKECEAWRILGKA